MTIQELTDTITRDTRIRVFDYQRNKHAEYHTSQHAPAFLASVKIMEIIPVMGSQIDLIVNASDISWDSMMKNDAFEQAFASGKIAVQIENRIISIHATDEDGHDYYYSIYDNNYLRLGGGICFIPNLKDVMNIVILDTFGERAITSMTLLDFNEIEDKTMEISCN